MNSWKAADLDLIFGSGTGMTPESRAKESSRLFVRSIDQLAEYSDKAKGRHLTAWEALSAYGFSKLFEVVLEGSAPLTPNTQSAGRALKDRREKLDLDVKHVANRANTSPNIVEAAENSKRLSIRQYERIARVLGLDERFLSFKNEAIGNENVAIRLRIIGSNDPHMTQSAVSTLVEAAWVAMTQIRMEKELGLSPSLEFKPNNNYGTPSFPAFEWGYHLASETRKELELNGDSIFSLRELSEISLGLPIIQTELGRHIAGATVEIDNGRAIVINIEGQNRHVYIRRMTIAHELGHILYDPPGKLESLRVDNFMELEKPAYQLADEVEQRANAFAVEFIAPRDAAIAVFKENPNDPLGEVMDHFGISFTAARYHLWNAFEREIPFEAMQSKRREPPVEWEAAERYTVDYHPLRRVRPSRAGRFSAVVVRAAQEKMISWDTAAELLESSVEEVKYAQEDIRDLFPTVFPDSVTSAVKRNEECEESPPEVAPVQQKVAIMPPQASVTKQIASESASEDVSEEDEKE